MTLKITMFSDFVCPFCYIGFETVRGLKSEFSLDIEWRGFQIHPEWPAEGMPAERLMAGADSGARRAAWERIKSLADAINLPMRPPAMLTNSRLALEAAEFACEAGRGEQFEERVYRAYFQEGANIGDRETLVRLGAEVELDGAALESALTSGKYGARLKHNAHDAHQRGVSGVPTFFIGEFPLVGAQNIDVMRHILKRARERMAS
jgi:predicted DsbA family dithiol-disulfide isomerase